LSRELADVAPYSFTDQRHLDPNTPERAYWHQGYRAALTDVLHLLGDDDVTQRSGTEGRSS
jgi:hypothetical protein